MTTPRGLTPEEAAAWQRITATVTPLRPARDVATPRARPPAGTAAPEAAWSNPAMLPPASKPERIPPPPPPAPRQPRPLDRDGLDGSWERRLAKAEVAPELTIDLHGFNLEQAHARLVGGLGQALAMGVRIVLLVTGKPRPHGEHDARGGRRGAIRAKLLDWLAASPHADRIAAVRTAHPRHGGAGAVYIILKRRR